MKHLWVTLFFIICSFSLISQVDRGSSVSRRAIEPLFQKETPGSFMIRHVSGAFDQKEHTNQIVAMLGEIYGSSQFSADWKYTTWLDITRDGDHLRMTAKVKGGTIEMPRARVGYDYMPFIIPDRMNFRLQLIDNTESVLFEEQFRNIDISALPANGQYLEIAKLQVPEEFNNEEFILRGLRLRITEIVSPRPQLLFFHSPEKHKSLSDFRHTVIDYERDADLLAEDIRRIRSIDVDDLTKIQGRLEELDAIRLRTDALIDRDYLKTPILKRDDPKGLAKNLETFATIYHETRGAVQQTLKNLDEVYYNRGMEFLRNRNLVQALAMFNQVLSINPVHVKANYQIASIDFQQNRIDDAYVRAGRILSEMNPDRQMIQEVQKLLQSIRDERAKVFLDEYKGLILQAEREWMRGNIPEALQLLTRAGKYQSENQQYITSDADVMFIFNKIIDGLAAPAEADVRAGRYPGAIQKYQDIIGLCQRYASELTNFGKLERRIQEIQATSINIMIEKALQTRDFTAAEFYLKEAMDLLHHNPSHPASLSLEAHKANLLSAYLTEGMKFLISKDFERAIDFFDRGYRAQFTYGIQSRENIQMLVMQAQEGLAMRMLDDAQGMLNRGNYGQGMEILRQAGVYLDDLGIGGQAQGKLVITADNFFREILQQIDNSNRSKSYSNALDFISEARYLCNNFTIRCDASLIDQRESNTRQGIFRNILGEAEHALNRGDLGLAKGKVAEATRYQNTWPQFIASGTEADQVMSRIRQKEYQNAIEAGRLHLNRKDYGQALAMFDEAYSLESDGGFPVDARLYDMRTTAALNYILTETDRLEQMLNQASFMASKDKLLQLLTMRSRYQLQDNKEIETRLMALQVRMVSAECRQQKETYDAHMIKAYEFARQRDFISAGSSIRKAIAAASQIPGCDISDTSATRYLVQLTPAIKYQERITESARLLKEYKNPEALAAYIDAEALYHSGNVHVYGLDHEPLATFVTGQNLNFILTAAYYYKEQGQVSEALRMIHVLANRGYPAAQTRLLQEQIGFRLGSEDRQKFPASTWKVAVLEYTGGNKFYKFFRKAYKKGWKS